MTQDNESPIQKITSSDPMYQQYQNCGTGFKIYQDGDISWFLTCRHVLKDVGGEKKALLGGMKVSFARVRDESSPVDLAVLGVKGFDKVSPLKLSPYAVVGDSVVIDGFYLYDVQRKVFKNERISAILAQRDGFSTQETAERVKGWSLECKEALKKGYSGSPVIDVKTRRAVGVVTYKEEGKTGAAICIDALEKVIDKMPIELKAALKVPLADPDATDTKAKECDRDKQAIDFTRLIPDECNDMICQNLLKDFAGLLRNCSNCICHSFPRFFFILGDRKECHTSLIQRFQNTILYKHARKKFPENTKLVPDFSVRLPLLNCDIYMKNKQPMLLNIMPGRHFPAESCNTFLLPDFCTFLSSHYNKVVILIHHIDASRWTRKTQKFIRWYITDYWDSLPKEGPCFYNFFNIEYDSVEGGFWKRLFSVDWWTALLVRERLRRFGKKVAKKRLFIFLEELKPVDRADVSSWLRQYELYSQDAVQLGNKLEEIFDNKTRLEMIKVEPALKDIADEESRKKLINQGVL